MAAEKRSDLARLVAALGRRGARISGAARSDGRVEVVTPEAKGPIFVGAGELLREALAQGLVEGREGEGWGLSAAGAAFLRRRKAPGDSFRRQHLQVATEPSRESATGVLEIVENESPLAWLRRRRGADGQPLITATQFAAGERLRADYTRSGMMPRLGIDLAQQPGGAQPAANRVADAMDSAIAARQRVRLAMDFLGPRLGSLLVDVCCELVGLEEAERRRGWPRRSAKVVLTIALDRLAEHYGLGETATGPEGTGRLRQWGTSDYRPSAGD